MKGQHHGTLSHALSRWLALACCLVGLGLTPAHAGTATASITGFVKNPTKIGGNYIRQDNILITLEAQMAKAESTYVSTALGKSLAGQAALHIVPAVAGPAIMRACFAAPLLCAGAGVAGYVALSNIRLDDDEWTTDDEEFGMCLHAMYPDSDPQTDYMPCSKTAIQALTSWVNTANATNYLDSNPNSNPRWNRTFTTGTACTPSSQRSTCNTSTVTWTQVHTLEESDGMGGVRVTVTETSGQTSVPIRRETDEVHLYPRPATQNEMVAHANNNPVTQEVLNEVQVPIPVDRVEMQDSVATLGDTYSPDDSPNEGPWAQDRVRASPNPNTPDDTDLTTTTETVPVDNPNTPDQEGPIDGNDPDPDPPTDPGTEEPPPFDLCKEHPNIVACQDFGEVPNDEVPTSTYDMAWNAEPLGLPATCPAPISMGAHGQFEFTEICDAAVAVSPLIVALGAISAAGIMLAAIRR